MMKFNPRIVYCIECVHFTLGAIGALLTPSAVYNSYSGYRTIATTTIATTTASTARDNDHHEAGEDYGKYDMIRVIGSFYVMLVVLCGRAWYDTSVYGNNKTKKSVVGAAVMVKTEDPTSDDDTCATSNNSVKLSSAIAVFYMICLMLDIRDMIPILLSNCSIPPLDLNRALIVICHIVGTYTHVSISKYDTFMIVVMVAMATFGVMTYIPVAYLCNGVIAAILYLLFNGAQVDIDKQGKHIPSPRYIPWFGNAFELYKNLNRFHEWNAEVSEAFQGKTWAVFLPLQATQWRFTDEACIKFILKDKFESFGRSTPGIPDYPRELFGQGIANVDGQKWKVQRKTAAHMFSQSNVRDNMAVVWKKHMVHLVKKIRSLPEAKSFDIQRLLFDFTQDTIMEIALGIPTTALIQGDDQRCTFSEAFERSQRLIIQRFLRPIPWFRIVRGKDWDASEKQIKTDLKLVDDFMNRAITICREKAAAAAAVSSPDLTNNNSNSSNNNNNKFNDIVSSFIRYGEEKNIEMTDSFLRDVAMTYLTGGRDTAACAMSWFFHAFVQYPEEAKRVVQEIDSVLGGHEPTEKTVHQLPILSAFVNEAFRLHPSVPYNQKFALEPIVFPDGTHVRKGDICSWPIYAIGRSTNIWGPDAMMFRPSRHMERKSGGFMKSTESKVDAGEDVKKEVKGDDVKAFSLPCDAINMDSVGTDQFMFPAMNAGPRTCLGISMAKTELRFVIASLLQQFEFTAGETPAELKNEEYDFNITLMRKVGVKVIAKPRVNITM